MAEHQFPPSRRDEGKSFAAMARPLGTQTTIPVFRLIEPTVAELAAITMAEDHEPQGDEKVTL